MNLAYRMRPTTLDAFVGQHHVTGVHKIVQQLIAHKQFISLILWGPPGTGKTTLAHIIAHELGAVLYTLSGVESGKAQLTEIVKKAHEVHASGRRSILFIDEIHRWNKAQQDALLPHVESGLITLIGATTENPSFEVNSALLSRSKVLVLEPLSPDDLSLLINRALTDAEAGLGAYQATITDDARELLIRLSGGDARVLLNALEMAVVSYAPDAAKKRIVTVAHVEDVFQTKSAGLYDKKGESHYNVISAFIKSMRGSDVDAALYYLHRMLESGEDPKFIARRMIIFASEDIGMADRGALIQANEAFEAVQKVGLPECALTLTHVVIYLSLAKKSRAVADAMVRAKDAVTSYPNEPVPLHLRNAPTSLMKDIGYGTEYTWRAGQVGPADKKLAFLPKKLKGMKFWKEEVEK